MQSLPQEFRKVFRFSENLLATISKAEFGHRREIQRSK